MANDAGDSRRTMLKKTAAFAVPTLVTIHLSSLKVAASGGETGRFQGFSEIMPEKE